MARRRLSDEEFNRELRRIAFSPGNKGAGAAKLVEKMRDAGFSATPARVRAWQALQATAPSTVGADRKEANTSRSFDVEIPSALIQVDTLFLPKDKDGSRYLLTCWDAASRWRDGEPMVRRDALTAARAFAEIMQRGPLKWLRRTDVGQIISVDAGSEFKGPFRELVEGNGAKLRVGMKGDHRHVGGAESANKAITIRLFGAQNYEEARTGRVSRDWVSELRPALRSLNSEVNRDTGLKPAVAVRKRFVDQPTPPERPLEKQVLLAKGTRVRVLLPEPSEGGTRFRVGDQQWSQKIYTITDVRIAPDQAASYLTSFGDRTFVRAGLLPVYGREEEPAPKEKPKRGRAAAAAAPAAAAAADTFIVERLVRPTFAGGVAKYEVKWKGYPASQNTVEPRAQLLKDVPELVKAFEEKNGVKWTAKGFSWKKKR